MVLAENMPPAEWAIDERLVSMLLADQFPGLSDRPLTLLGNGWDNVMFRLGDDLTVRLPRRQVAVALIGNEQRCLELLAPRLPLPVPVPLHCGVPTETFPMPWSICAWLPGDLAVDASFDDPLTEARRLGEFLAALHSEAPSDAPRNEFRGHDVGSLTSRVVANLSAAAAADASIDEPSVLALWATLSSVAPYTGPPVWLHGDLHALNLLVEQGAISAVIDFGDVTSGDPAVDLAIGWMLFDVDARAEFRRHMVHVDEATWTRGAAWALHFGLMYVANSADDTRMRNLGEAVLATVLRAADT